MRNIWEVRVCNYELHALLPKPRAKHILTPYRRDSMGTCKRRKSVSNGTGHMIVTDLEFWRHDPAWDDNH